MAEKRKILRFVSAMAVTWVITQYLCPAIINAIPAWKRLASIEEEMGISPAAIYYTDVEANSTAELHSRHTILYPPKGPAAR